MYLKHYLWNISYYSYLHCRDAYYQMKMAEQMKELEDLNSEKTRLLNLQNQLQAMHNRYQQVSTASRVLSVLSKKKIHVYIIRYDWNMIVNWFKADLVACHKVLI